MNRGAYYNEFDRAKAAWLRHLIEEGEIARGVVDERSIHEVQPEDLAGFAQCHFFAGVGVHSYALRRAGWADDDPIWSGSCPCGPFSSAGLQKGFADPRHLWPEWFRLIRVGRPHCILGEQVDAADAWIDLVSADLESLDYAFGSPDLPAAGFGGAHIRQRFLWMADADNAEWWSERAPWHDGFWPKTGRVQGDGHVGQRGTAGRLAYAHINRRGARAGDGFRDPEHHAEPRGDAGGLGDAGSFQHALRTRVPRGEDRPDQPQRPGAAGGLADPHRFSGDRRGTDDGPHAPRPSSGPHIRASGLYGGAGADWLYCRDGRWRPIESGLSPVVDASPARLVQLRGYGDAVDAEALTQFIAAFMDVSPNLRAAA